MEPPAKVGEYGYSRLENPLLLHRIKQKLDASPNVTMEPYFDDLASTGSLSVQGCLKGVTFLRGAGGQAKCHRLTGIPYGLPLVGDLRWRRPLPLPEGYQYSAEDQPLDCSNFPPACSQLQCREFLAPLVSSDPKNGSSEACMNLNMWIPVDEPPREGWPVYFYLRESTPIIVQLSQMTETPSQTGVSYSFAMPTSTLLGIPLICYLTPTSAVPSSCPCIASVFLASWRPLSLSKKHSRLASRVATTGCGTSDLLLSGLMPTLPRSAEIIKTLQ